MVSYCSDARANVKILYERAVFGDRYSPADRGGKVLPIVGIFVVTGRALVVGLAATSWREKP